MDKDFDGIVTNLYVSSVKVQDYEEPLPTELYSTMTACLRVYFNGEVSVVTETQLTMPEVLAIAKIFDGVAKRVKQSIKDG
jgi:hypothetical protein